MIRSMTAFARISNVAATWEIRSINHRYLDISFRIPDSLRELEMDLSDIVRGHIERGKIECSLKLNELNLLPELSINEPLLEALQKLMTKVQHKIGIENVGDVLSVLRWPGLIKTKENEKILHSEVRKGFSKAVAEIVKMRKREGKVIAGVLRNKTNEIGKIVANLKEEVPKIHKAQEKKMQARLKNLKIQVDHDRFEQELVFLIQKTDIEEELDRLNSHIKEVNRNLSLQEPVGRRLDFLMQELNREANTISSKSHALSTTNNTLDLKVIIEQIREQVQNIE
ncbi:MAG: YicC family protein [Gammaproteobacteria bacterium]|nr:YicC family protein [Gammaproteobacteria bacterium]